MITLIVFLVTVQPIPIALSHLWWSYSPIMNNYEVIRDSIQKGKITRIGQILIYGTPAFWSYVLHIGENNARKKIEKKGANMILRDALALAEFFEVGLNTIVDLIEAQQQHGKDRIS